MKQALPEEEKTDQTWLLFETINFNKTNDIIPWSEFQVALAYETQLNEKNLRNVYQYLNMKNNSTGIKLKHLHSAMKPHIFRLKLERGTEKRVLEEIMDDLEKQILRKEVENFNSTEVQADQIDSASYLDPSQ